MHEVAVTQHLIFGQAMDPSAISTMEANHLEALQESQE